VHAARILKNATGMLQGADMMQECCSNAAGMMPEESSKNAKECRKNASGWELDARMLQYRCKSYARMLQECCRRVARMMKEFAGLL